MRKKITAIKKMSIMVLCVISLGASLTGRNNVRKIEAKEEEDEKIEYIASLDSEEERQDLEDNYDVCEETTSLYDESSLQSEKIVLELSKKELNVLKQNKLYPLSRTF